MGAIAEVALEFLEKFWKEILFAVVIGGLAFGVYTSYEHIVQIGYTKGFAAGQADKQKVIDAMLAQQSKDNQAMNDKIAGLEAQSKTAAATEFALRAQVETAQTTVITKYVQTNPADAKKCGFTKTAAAAVNNILLADPAIVNGGSK